MAYLYVIRHDEAIGHVSNLPELDVSYSLIASFSYISRIPFNVWKHYNQH